MRIGPRSWRWVSTKSAGVPHGGQYGDVAWFQQELGRRGLYLAWSRLWNRFCVYSRRGPSKVIPQLICMNWSTYRPIPLNRELLSMLVRMWEGHCRQSAESIAAYFRRQEAEDKAREEAEAEALSDAMESDVMRAVDLRMGNSTPVKMVLPAGRVRILGRG